MTSEERIAELEEQLRLVQLGRLKQVELEKSRMGNVYWDYDFGRSAKTGPYDGNDRQFVSLFADDRYAKFVREHGELQDYWHERMYCVKRSPDDYMEVCSNIHRGDFFGCGKTSMVGHVYGKVTYIQCGLKPENQKPSPQGPGGNYIGYWIGGDIGGHWYSKDHDDFVATRHFLWLPTVERLMFSGFTQQAKELMGVFEEICNGV